MRRLLASQLTPASTITDLLALAAEAEAAGGHQATGADARRASEAASAERPRRPGTQPRVLTVGKLKQLFLYEHFAFAVQSLRLSYRLPGEAPASAPLAPQQAPLAYQQLQQPSQQQQQQQPYQPPQPLVSMLPPSLRLHGVVSRSRLDQDTSAPSLAIKLWLDGADAELTADKVSAAATVVSMVAGTGLELEVTETCLAGQLTSGTSQAMLWKCWPVCGRSYACKTV
jgi:hypothetical protein